MFEIRQAKPEDAAAYLAYLQTIGAESDNLTFGAEGIGMTVALEKAYLQRVQEDFHSVQYLAIKDGDIIADGSLNALSGRMGHRAELGIAVIKAEWGKGVGSAMMQTLLNYAGIHGTELIHLEVRADNLAAIRLYEKFGFVQVGHFPAYFKMPDGSYVDFLMMVLDLRK